MSENTNILIASYLSGNINSEDQRALNNWLNESEANKAEFERAKKLWRVALNQKTENTYDSSLAWNDFLELKRKTELKGNGTHHYYRMAAAFILIVTTAIVVKLLLDDKEVEEPASNLTTVQDLSKGSGPEFLMTTLYSEDSVSLFTLPDNSKVYLNKNSVLEYPENFEMEGRATHLTGEAFFEVVPYDGGPFTVDCNGIKVKVMGTAFGIRTLANDRVEISVKSGTVEVRNEQHSDTTIVLQQDQKAVFGQQAPFFSREIMSEKDYKWKEKKRMGPIKRLIQKLRKKKRN
jgi:transmembrane sensor